MGGGGGVEGPLIGTEGLPLRPVITTIRPFWLTAMSDGMSDWPGPVPYEASQRRLP